jgi:hypothetical protein
MKRVAIFLLFTALIYGCNMQKPSQLRPGAPPKASSALLQATCVSGSDQVQLASAWKGNVDDGIVLFGCGAPHSMPTPAAPTVTPSIALVMVGTGDVVDALPGTIQYDYEIIACDKGGGCTAASPVGSTSTGNPLGSQSFSILAASRANKVTSLATRPQSLVPGAMVLLSSGISDNSFRGWYQAAPVTDSTHFTLRPVTQRLQLQRVVHRYMLKFGVRPQNLHKKSQTITDLAILPDLLCAYDHGLPGM